MMLAMSAGGDHQQQQLIPAQASAGANVKIALLNVWIGSRSTSVAFAKSSQPCIHDPRVDLLVIVDEKAVLHFNESTIVGNGRERVVRIPNFVEFIHQKLEEAFPETVNHTRFDIGRKVVDYRHMFGFIFKDLLAGYTHWGWIDVHGFLGDILGPASHFGRDFENYDVVSVLKITRPQRAYTRGALSVFKNNDHINRLFYRIPGLVDLSLSPENKGVDEIAASIALVANPNVSLALIGFGLFDPVTFCTISIEDGRFWGTLAQPGQIEACKERDADLDFFFAPPMSTKSLSKEQDSSNVLKKFGTIYRSRHGRWSFTCHERDVYRTNAEGKIVAFNGFIGTCRNCELCPQQQKVFT